MPQTWSSAAEPRVYLGPGEPATLFSNLGPFSRHLIMMIPRHSTCYQIVNYSQCSNKAIKLLTRLKVPGGMHAPVRWLIRHLRIPTAGIYPTSLHPRLRRRPYHRYALRSRLRHALRSRLRHALRSRLRQPLLRHILRSLPSIAPAQPPSSRHTSSSPTQPPSLRPTQPSLPCPTPAAFVKQHAAAFSGAVTSHASTAHGSTAVTF